jgi:serine/threonine protein kinase/Tol biopolymer transport system component
MEMDATRWAAIERLYHAAREREDAAERAAFLDSACAGDAALRAEVESLLAHDRDASALMNEPAAAQLAGAAPAAAMRFDGVRFGPYKLGARLGAGGMGEVYRAEDTRLGRDVAVKVLPAYLSSDPARRARLEREARAIAAVTHPNICALYDVGREGDVEFLVLEYVQGDTLARRLERGRLPLDEALRIAREMAAALAAAHAIGIVHRDLKPANVVLTREGAKLLDFGLAKLVAPAGSTSVSQPTEAPSLTAIGTILGTVQYMSPEQVEGRETDARSDIFAFGAILHEMLSGMKAFEGKSQASLMAAILEREPTPLPQLRPETPPALARVVRTCLAKDPARRWQSAVDLERELAWVREDLGSGTVQQPVLPVRGRLKAGLAWGIAVIAIVIAAVSVIWRERPARRLPGPPLQLGFEIPIEPASVPRFATISPDARYVTFVETDPDAPEESRLWIHDLRASQAHAIEDTTGAQFPFWSPDSRSIAFFARGALRRLDTTTGSIQTLCDAPGGRGGAWGPDGTIVFAGVSTPLMRISAQGGQATSVTKLDPAKDRGHRLPFFLEDGRHFLFTKIRVTEGNVVAVGSLDSGDTVDILSGGGLETQGEFAAGKLIYVREGALVAQDFDVKSLAPRGERVPLVRRVGDDGLSRSAFSVSADGTIVYRSAANQISQLTAMSRRGAVLRTLGKAGVFFGLGVSPDGRSLAVARLDPSTDLSSIWVMNLLDGHEAVAVSGADSASPVWTADGKRILYQRARGWAIYDVYATDLETGRDELLVQSDRASLAPFAALPDRTVLYGKQGNTGDDQLWRAIAGASAPGERIVTASPPFDVDVSPDGRWMAYTSIVGERAEVIVQGYPSGPRRQITSGGGGQAQWSGDGKELYFLTDKGTRLNAAPVVVSPALAVGTPRVLFEVPRGSTYAPGPDGQTFYVALRQLRTRPPPLMVLVNWLEK